MSSRLTRKDIKRDEVLETIGGFVGFVTRNARAILLGIAGLIVLALGFAVYRGFAEGRAEEAGRELGKALTVFGAQIDPAAPNPDDPLAPTFADEASRATRASELFESLADEYSGTDAADIAGAYLGTLAASDGRLEEAQEHWREFLSRQSGHVLAGEIRLNLMAVDRALGKSEALVDELRAELSSGRGDLPEDVLLAELAKTLEGLDRNDEALDIYRRLVQDFPLSGLARTASERIALLEAASSG